VPIKFNNDQYGNYQPAPATYSASSPLVTFARGYHYDGKVICIGNTSIPIPTPVFLSEFKYD
jgi:hypothetical protein